MAGSALAADSPIPDRRVATAALAKRVIASLRKEMASGGRVETQQVFGAARLVIVAGKGGVGKTTVTAVIAHAAAAAGLRVAAIDLEGKPALANMLADSPVEVTTITASDALGEYLDTHGLGRVAKRLANSGVIEVVATAAPGIDDIVVLGKLKQLERSGEYDLVVVDGPAAGHAITFLLSPAGLLETVRSGPIRVQAQDVLEMFADPQRCQVVLVGLPEATPINELIETAYMIEERVGVQLGPVVMNGVDPGPEVVLSGTGDLSADDPLIAAAEFRNHRLAWQRGELERLAGELALDRYVLPQLPVAGISAADVATLAAALVAQLGDRAWDAPRPQTPVAPVTR
ncbi:MAG TPA: ArsA-related P-loop ATPase [Ilumatobacteraceae bacterium]|nr:ArsA-related P-loop ATPase [Ilumatobacteraceae bacterium]